MASPGREHQLIVGELFMQFYACIEKCKELHDDCEVVFAPADVRLDKDDKTMVQPDLYVICHEDENEMYVEGAPELTVEVLSASTRGKDCILKLNKYMMAGVKEFWIVDPKNKIVMVYIFEEDEIPTQYSFNDMIPIGISEGKCNIDFRKINNKLKRFSK